MVDGWCISRLYYHDSPTNNQQTGQIQAGIFSSPTPRFSLAPPRTRTHTTKEVGGRSSPGPADVVGTIRLMSFLSDDAPSPSQATRSSTGEKACHQMPGASRCPVPLVPVLERRLNRSSWSRRRPYAAP
jgi:hypothetical protein